MGDSARAGAARVRAASVRPPALGALLVGDDRPAEGDRPRPGRHPARAPEGAPLSHRRAARRPALLVHDHGLDDVELPRRRAAHRHGDRALRRQPPTDALWDLAESAGITCFGTSAAYIHACLKAGVEPAAGRDLSRLRAVGSTGSPLSPDGFRWVYDSLGEDTWLFSMSGGTDVCTAFVGGVPGLPVYEGELQARALGAKVEAFDEHGRPLIGEVGELVLTEPLPSMPICLWNDPDGARYRESLLLDLPGRVAPRRLDRDHRARHRRHPRPLGRDDQPRRRPDGHRRALRRRAGASTRSPTHSRSTRTARWLRSSSSYAKGRS